MLVAFMARCTNVWVLVMKRVVVILVVLSGLLGVTGCQQVNESPGFEENADLRASREALLAYMRTVDNVDLPDDANWRPSEMGTVDDATTYQYENGRWRMALALPAQSPATYLYLARVTGPGGFSYLAEIRAGQQIAPAQ